MATTFKKENQGKPTPPFWKTIGKILVWSMPVVTAVIMVTPLPPAWKTVVTVGANALLALGKELTTYTFNPKKVPITYFPQPEIPEQPTTKDVTEEVEKIAEVKAVAEEKLKEDISK
jgi:hypothetical protein